MALASGLSRLTSLTRLELGDNPPLGAAEGGALAAALTALTAMERLEFGNVGEPGATVIAAAIGEWNLAHVHQKRAST